jgi:p21-activated kinase 1
MAQSPAAPRPTESHLPSNLSPLNQYAADDLIGAPFDGAAILNRLDPAKPTSPSYQQPTPPQNHRSPSIKRPRVPLALGSFGTEKKVVSPPLRSSASFSNMDPSISEKMQGGRPDRADTMQSAKRYSDDGKDLKSTVMRKKTGLSGFMNSLVGSQKKPAISAPENPVHVTHVGYDSSTGQFTVSLSHFS